MHPKRKQKLLWILAGLVGLSLCVALVLYALKEQSDFYYDPTQISMGHAPENKRIRAGGIVVKNSVLRSEQDPLSVTFQITDLEHTVNVSYRGILPDLFKEDSGVVVTGMLNQGNIVAETVLAKHDENYMPPEVEKSLTTQPSTKKAYLP